MSTYYDEKVSAQHWKLHYKKTVSELLKEYEISPQDLESAQKVIKLINNNDDNEYRLVIPSILYTELPYMAEQLSLKEQAEQLSLKEQKEQLRNRFTLLIDKASTENEILIFKKILDLITTEDSSICLNLDEVQKLCISIIKTCSFIND